MTGRELTRIRKLWPDDPEPGGRMSRRVTRVEYEHVEDDAGTVRVHDFGPGFRMDALPGGRGVVIHHPKRRTWMDF